MLHVESSSLMAHAAYLTRNLPDAWDLFQDTIERALRSERRESALANAKPWLLTIMQNLFIDRCRSARVRRTRPLTPALIETLYRIEAEPEVPSMWRTANDEAVNRCIRALPEPMLAIFQMKRAGFSYIQIAAHFKMKIKTVGTCLNRARSRIRKLMLKVAADPLAADIKRAATDDPGVLRRPRSSTLPRHETSIGPLPSSSEACTPLRAQARSPS